MSRTKRSARALEAMSQARKQSSPEMRVLADLMAQGIYDEKLKKALSMMFEANRNEVHRHLEQSFHELGLKPKVALRVIPRLVLGMLDGLALHDFFDPPSEADEQVVQDALHAIALSLVDA